MFRTENQITELRIFYDFPSHTPYLPSRIRGGIKDFPNCVTTKGIECIEKSKASMSQPVNTKRSRKLACADTT